MRRQKGLGPAISRRPPVGKIGLWYQCLRKLPYSRKDAERERNIRNRALRPLEREYNAYRCDHCGHYHVGHVKAVNATP